MVAPTIFHKAQDYSGLRLFQTFQVCPESYRRVRARPCGRFKVQCPSREFKVPSSKFKVILESVQIVQAVQSLRFVQHRISPFQSFQPFHRFAPFKSV